GGSPVQGAQRSAEVVDDRMVLVRVRSRQRGVHGSAWQTFGDVPQPVRSVAVTEASGVWDLTAAEQAGDCSLVAKRVAKLAVAQSYDVFVADPYAIDPAGPWKKAPGCRQASGRQRPQQGPVGR